MALTRPKYSQIYDTDYKQSVRVATTADVGDLSLTGNMPDEVDGVLLNYLDRILVKNQNDASQNGIYRVLIVGTGNNGTWDRALDADANDKITAGMTTVISEGDINVNKTFRLATPDPILLGFTNLIFINPFIAPDAAGEDGQLQFNDDGLIGADSGLTYDVTSNSLTVSGNVVSDGYFIGDGSQLTGIIAGTNYGDSNVAAYLPTHTGNVSAANFLGNLITANSAIEGAIFSVDSILNVEAGTSNIQVYSSGDIAVSSAGVANVVVVNNTGTTVTGNVSAAYFRGNLIGNVTGTLLTNSQPNITSVGTLLDLAVTGNIIAGNIIPNANVTYSLGSETSQWKDLYLSGNTIYLGGTALSIVEGNLAVNGSTVVGVAAGGLTGQVLTKTSNDDYATAWQTPSSEGSGGLTASSSPPLDPAAGEFWYDTELNILFQYIDDGDSSQWVDTTSATTVYSGSGGGSSPSTQEYTAQITSSGVATTIDSWSTGQFSGGKYNLIAINNINSHNIYDFIVIHNQVSADYNLIGNVQLGGSTGNISVAVNNSNVEVLFTATQSNTNLKFNRTLITTVSSPELRILPTDLETESFPEVDLETTNYPEVDLN
jgi:hypothetical protein